MSDELGASGPEGGDERVARAGEYVLGTLLGAERAAVERDLLTDPALRALVRAWEQQLAGLASAIPAVAPDGAVWRAIERALDQAAAAATGATPEGTAGDGTAVGAADVVQLGALRRSRGRWRGAALGLGAIAAMLALALGLGRQAGPDERYLAVVERGGALPALVVEVDLAAGVVRVRSVAAETPADRSLELWYIAPAGGAPRSLGVLAGLQQGTRRATALPAAARSEGLEGATLAVSVEPVGGSRTGAPTGPVIYSGRLVLQ